MLANLVRRPPYYKNMFLDFRSAPLHIAPEMPLPVQNTRMSKATVQHVCDDKLYIAQGVVYLPETSLFQVFVPKKPIVYIPFCDDFGPMNMACIADFISQLDDKLNANSSSRLIYTVDNSKRSLTNAVFLLGAYMILARGASTEDVDDCFSWLKPDQFEDYRDATYSQPTFRLSLVDCWRGLEKGVRLGWVAPPDEHDDEFWGMIDIAEYKHNDSPINADLHEVVPGKFVAFRGPQDLAGAEYEDDSHGFRRFSPSFYVDTLKDHGVTTVVRLNEARYDAAAFEEHNIRVVELEFDDCTAPPPHIVTAFLAAADADDGAVAVHCKAGLGRTGTLIGVWMMLRRGFTAREAMGWLRIMRPGSVIGEQQHYLCALDEQLQRRGDGGNACSTFDEAEATSMHDTAFVRVASALHEEGRVSRGSSAGEQAAEVAGALERRAAELVRRASSGAD